MRDLSLLSLPRGIIHMLWAFSNGNTSTTSKIVLEWVIPDWWCLSKSWHEILHFWVQALPWTWQKQLHPGSYCYTACGKGATADAPTQGWVIRGGRKGERRTRWYSTPNAGVDWKKADDFLGVGALCRRILRLRILHLFCWSHLGCHSLISGEPLFN